ncbi:hypothetical protein F9L33_01320 [Amylibacter sp. SFDW26]|uniref:hypothetical protein n=1 Tax=Amylibacter sp. SFDW26 TaxID=2652722 RepID=UPI0012628635|nr:hypothetical protein [Amylibacter sp. SFDW26]KAB7615435.1 hypothetical protein F9L33_01320 [Amylibacter sp. SFDW26]
MPDLTKIATCSYCQTRSVLTLRNIGHKELSCSSCGAPLHEMKFIKQTPKAVKHTPVTFSPLPLNNRPVKKKKRYKKRSDFWEDVIEEVWDFVEDIFD